MDKKNDNNTQMPPFNYGPGVHVNKLTTENMLSMWLETIDLANKQFANKCTNYCNGCKQLAKDHPCEIARVRFAILKANAETYVLQYNEAVALDLVDIMFSDAPYYDKPA